MANKEAIDHISADQDATAAYQAKFSASNAIAVQEKADTTPPSSAQLKSNWKGLFDGFKLRVPNAGDPAEAAQQVQSALAQVLSLVDGLEASPTASSANLALLDKACAKVQGLHQAGLITSQQAGETNEHLQRLYKLMSV